MVMFIKNIMVNLPREDTMFQPRLEEVVATKADFL